MVVQAGRNTGVQFNKELTESHVLSISTALSVTELRKHYLENKEK